MQISDASGSEPVVPELGRLGKYHLIASLGQGGMAKVYLALLAGPSDFNKLLVVKVMRQDLLAGSEQTVRMFWAEARLAARLLHPNIVQTQEVGEHEGQCFLAMEYLDGQPLSSILNRARAGRDLPLGELVRVISEIARGLHYAHQLKGFQGEDLHVVHRDVSPQNVIVTYEGHGKLVDFGIAKTSDGEQTQLGLIKGKLDYIAPEQLLGEHVDARADVFALGAILWEVVSGQRFAGGRSYTDGQKVQTRLAGLERRLLVVKPDAPHELAQIVERAIAISPAERFQDAASFADALDAWLEQENLRPNPRALAGRLTNLFAVERAEMHHLIERQIKLVKSTRSREGERTHEHGPSDPAKLSGLGLFVSDSDHERSSSYRTASAMRASTIAPARGMAATVAWALSALISLAVLLFLWLKPPSRYEARALASHTQTAAAPSRTGGNGPPPLPLLPAQVPSPSQAPQSARPAQGAPTPESSFRTVTIQLQVTPPDAAVLVDGVRVQIPFQASFRSDATLHHLAVSANGYRPAKEFVAFDQDKTISIDLQPAHAASRAARLDHLVERAAQTVVRHPESERTFPTVYPQTQAKDPHPAQPARLDPIIERPNPY